MTWLGQLRNCIYTGMLQSREPYCICKRRAHYCDKERCPMRIDGLGDIDEFMRETKGFVITGNRVQRRRNK